MLVLGRRLGEKIIIDDNISVQVLEISKNFVKLGFVAPDEVEIHRKEVYDKIVAKEYDVLDGN